jgi:hypothetical protein
MNPNDDIVDRGVRLGPLHQLHPGRSRSLVRHHDRLRRPPLCQVLWQPTAAALQRIVSGRISDLRAAATLRRGAGRRRFPGTFCLTFLDLV